MSDINGTVRWTNNYYKIGNATIWVCYKCGEMFDSEICMGFTGECYKCHPRPDKMTGVPFVGFWESDE